LHPSLLLFLWWGSSKFGGSQQILDAHESFKVKLTHKANHDHVAL